MHRKCSTSRNIATIKAPKMSSFLKYVKYASLVSVIRQSDLQSSCSNMKNANESIYPSENYNHTSREGEENLRNPNHPDSKLLYSLLKTNALIHVLFIKNLVSGGY